MHDTLKNWPLVSMCNNLSQTQTRHHPICQQRYVWKPEYPCRRLGMTYCCALRLWDQICFTCRSSRICTSCLVVPGQDASGPMEGGIHTRWIFSISSTQICRSLAIHLRNLPPLPSGRVRSIYCSKDGWVLFSQRTNVIPDGWSWVTATVVTWSPISSWLSVLFFFILPR